MALPLKEWHRAKATPLACAPWIRASEGQRVRMSKRAQRALEQMRMAPSPAARRGMARRVHHLPRPVQLELLDALLHKDEWELALMVYRSTKEDGWFKEDLVLQARLVAVLRKMEQVEVAEAVRLEILGARGPKQRVQLHCALIESYAYCGLHEQMIEVLEELQQIPYTNLVLQSQRAMLRAHTILKRPHQAEEVLLSMKKPSLDDSKLVLETFSKGGYLEEMEFLFARMKSAGLLDQAAFNMTLAAYAQANKQGKMLETLRVMVGSEVPTSVRTWNVICRACPVLNTICRSLLSETELQELLSATVLGEFGCMLTGEIASSQLAESNIDGCAVGDGPGLALRALLRSSHHLPLLLQSCGAEDEEIGLVQVLLALGLSPEGTLQPYRIDLHGMDKGTAFLTIFLWLRHTAGIMEQEALGNTSNTAEIVTGWGRHSDEQGKSLVRDVITAMLERMASPFTFERHNRGALVSRKHDVKKWLASCMASDLPWLHRAGSPTTKEQHFVDN